MKDFAAMFSQLDQTTKINVKVDALVGYFAQATEADRLWAMALLAERRPKRTVNTTLLRTWAAEMSGVPLWLFEESYHVVGDLAETIALVLPVRVGEDEQSLTYWINYIRQFSSVDDAAKRERVRSAWTTMDYGERFIFNKLITGNFRVGVSQKLMVRALAKYSKVEENVLAHRLMGNWSPDDTSFEQLVFGENPRDDISKPYPFYLAYQLENELETLGNPEEWQAEYKWDGIRGQIIVRDGQVFVWSRGEELVTDKYPEYQTLANFLPDGTVLDGEIMPFKDGRPLPFQLLQTRIGRKNVTKKYLDEVPVVLICYDILEWQGEDVRERPIVERRALLENLLEKYPTAGILLLSEVIEFESWEDLTAIRLGSREKFSEGLMLKRKNSTYKTGRRRGDWWKWKVDALVIDAVMIYAQRGHGRRANLYTDFTFAVWDGDALVPFTKAYSGLTDAEFREITNWVRKHTLEKFGPVRAVEPVQVFEIAFEGIQASSRHKSGVALRFPRMSRWRQDKPAAEANTIEDLKLILEQVSKMNNEE